MLPAIMVGNPPGYANTGQLSRKAPTGLTRRTEKSVTARERTPSEWMMEPLALEKVENHSTLAVNWTDLLGNPSTL